MKQYSLLLPAVAMVALLVGPHKSCDASYMQDFTDVNAITGNGNPLMWAWYNKSQNAGTTSGTPGTDPSIGGWYQGSPTGTFNAYSGAANAYARADYGSVPNFGDVISNWFITPTFDINTGDTFSFYTRTIAGSTFPDRLQVRLSQSGTSSDVGADWTTVGDFSTLLLEINPTEAQGVYPETWTLYSYTFTGTPIVGRIGFRYFVTDTNNNGNYIGLDDFSTTASLYNPVPEPSSYIMALTAMAVLGTSRYKLKMKNKSVLS